MIASNKELDITFSTGLGANLAQERGRNLERSWRRKKALKKTPRPLLKMSLIWSEWVVDGILDAKVLINYPAQISCKTYIQVKSHKEVQSGRHKCKVTIQFVINNFGEKLVLMKAEQNGKANESGLFLLRRASPTCSTLTTRTACSGAKSSNMGSTFRSEFNLCSLQLFMRHNSKHLFSNKEQ